MEELYSETYLKAKISKKKELLRIGLMVLSAFIVAVGLLFTILMRTILPLCVLVIVAGIILFLMPTNKVAYEYIFVDGQIDFDQILAESKRKTMERVDMEKIELIAPETSHMLDSHKALPIKDYSSGNKEDIHYIAVATGEKGIEKIRFTPDEKMLRMMKLKSPSKVVDR